VPGLRVESQPDEIAAVRNITGFHHNSRPAGAPQSVSECRFFVVMRDTNCRSAYLRRRGFNTMVPSAAEIHRYRVARGQSSPIRHASGNSHCQAISPHLETCVIAHTYLQ